MSSSEENISTSTSVIEKDKKHLGGRPGSLVWDYFTKGEKTGKGRYKATCDFCGTSWNRGEPIKLESHLANHCNTHGKLDQYVSVIELDQQKIKRIHLAWARAFAICGISWNIIENPFFIEALKETNLSYKPPTC
ncbi:5539_t:CDS:2 [Gigaspora margarita]|uniref:5539_t:CDS:1 n=1 Tax=Gigaspora margarita TaxID=4874 RepID=A0ABN7V976_GIGMA|nr:5539_t:CDS:2 [Gigaspora margarita]